MQQYTPASEDALDQAMTPFMNSEQSIDPNVLKELFKMRQRVGKHTIARRERAKSRISKRKNKR